MSLTYKLIYFNGRGSAEHIRMIFAYAGIKYQDVRIEEEKWPDLKKQTPYGMLPILEINGNVVPESNSIARYLAKKYNLAGKTDWESLECDVIVDAIDNLKYSIYKYIEEEDLAKKVEREKNLKTDRIPFFLNAFDKVVAKNNGFTVGSNVTWSDFVMVVCAENLKLYFDENLDDYKSVKGLTEKIYALPSIAEWIKKRPVTHY